MNCSRCRSRMVEIRHTTNHHSRQNWYQCTCCQRTQVITQPIIASDVEFSSATYPSRFTHDLLPSS